MVVFQQEPPKFETIDARPPSPREYKVEPKKKGFTIGVKRDPKLYYGNEPKAQIITNILDAEYEKTTFLNKYDERKIIHQPVLALGKI